MNLSSQTTIGFFCFAVVVLAKRDAEKGRARVRMGLISVYLTSRGHVRHTRVSLSVIYFCFSFFPFKPSPFSAQQDRCCCCVLALTPFTKSTWFAFFFFFSFSFSPMSFRRSVSAGRMGKGGPGWWLSGCCRVRRVCVRRIEPVRRSRVERGRKKEKRRRKKWGKL